MSGSPIGGNDGRPEPDLGVVASHDLAIRAGQAFLGAVMSDPARQAWLLDYVVAGDLARPYHGQVLAAMQRLRARRAPPGPAAVRAELAADPDLPRSVVLDGGPIIALLEAAPRPGHAPAYAAMVIERGIRQRLLGAASRLGQAAEHGLPDAALEAAHVGREVEACKRRRDALPVRVRHCLVSADPSGADIAVPVTRGLPSAGPEARAAGERLLRDLAAGPHHVPQVRAWLRPGHFASVEHSLLYALICDMHATRQDVDSVTIAWAAARNGIAVDPAVFDGGTAAFVMDGAREVRRLGLLALAGRAAENMATAAAEPRTSTAALLRDAAEQVRSLDHQLDQRGLRRLGAARTPAPRCVDLEASSGDEQAAEPAS